MVENVIELVEPYNELGNQAIKIPVSMTGVVVDPNIETGKNLFINVKDFIFAYPLYSKKILPSILNTATAIVISLLVLSPF